MIPGFNHNVKYKDQDFHIQTEDSGLSNPHILTHLYRGGDILASERQDYSEHLNDSNLTGLVRNLMQEQHKGVLRGLVRGAYDEKISGIRPLGGQVQEHAKQPIAEITRPHSMESVRNPVSDMAATASLPKAEEIILDAVAMKEIVVANRVELTNDSAPSSERLEPEQFSSAVKVEAESAFGLDDKISPPKGWSDAQPTSEPASSEQPGGRLSGNSEKPPADKNKAVIFGEDLISEKSLDEVILQFLREDFES